VQNKGKLNMRNKSVDLDCNKEYGAAARSMEQQQGRGVEIG
jgi:hypothetical protein